jgi:hypothetical protein
MKDGFSEIAAHEVAVNTRIPNLTTVAKRCEERAAMLESSATEFDKTLSAWKLEVESSLSSVRLQFSKLNDLRIMCFSCRKYFNYWSGISGTSSYPSVHLLKERLTTRAT